MCGRRLGLITGDVYDYQIESSSHKDHDHQFTFGRLFRPENGWCAKPFDNVPWFMVRNIHYFISVTISFS